MEPELPQFIHFGREVCNDLDQAERREWWLANGLGGYAAGTVAGTLTRRYHGLLVAPLRPPLGRTLVFAKADAELLIGETRVALHSNRWTSGVIEPRGYAHLESFHLDGRLPVWRYAIGDLRLEARIWMATGTNTTYLAWRLLTQESSHGDRPSLSVRLLVNARDHHGQTRAGEFDPAIEHTNEQANGELRVFVHSLPHSPVLRFHSRCGRFQPDRTWIERFDLPVERERGLPDQDNHLCVGRVDLPLPRGEWVGFVASLQEVQLLDLGEALLQAQHRDASLLRLAKVQNSTLAGAPAWIDQLVLAADSFLIERPLPDGQRGDSVIAGYPWFGDWGRDTFIALPGLTLCTHRHDEARRILLSWLPFIDTGLLPNYFPEGGATPEYNSADAALWYIEAWRAYFEASQDRATLALHFPALAGILDHYAHGTRHGIAMDPADGLLRAGDADSQLTWMDARVHGHPVTPRTGKAVELNALWYNALMSLAGFAHVLDRDPEPYAHLAAQARDGFKRFIRPDQAGLFDVLDGPEGDDARVRPNQIFAVSLAHSPLAPAEQAVVVRWVGARLLIPCGLRTLDPSDPDYHPRYTGDIPSRDAAYHQGPAWAWLLPHYALAVHRVTGDAANALALLEPLADHLTEAGLGTISELFDAEPPHTPRGAPSQAWSVACTLAAWCRLNAARNDMPPEGTIHDH